MKSFLAGVQDSIGYALYLAQLGGMSVTAKPLRGLGGGVLEISAPNAGGAFRAVYTVSKSVIETPKAEIDLIRQRLKWLRTEVKSAQE